MNRKKANIIIIDDEIRTKDDPFILEAKLIFNEVVYFDNPEDGISYIKDNLNKKNIVMLDLAFPRNHPDGHQILEEIRKFSFLIPVIIWSGRDEDKETFADLINNSAFRYIKKSASSEEIIGNLIKAEEYIDNSISSALEEWIEKHPEQDKDMAYIFTVDGKQLTLNDILFEVRMQTEIGKHFSKNLIKLTIDLISRNKEKIDD